MGSFNHGLFPHVDRLVMGDLFFSLSSIRVFVHAVMNFLRVSTGLISCLFSMHAGVLADIPICHFPLPATWIS